MIDGVVTESKHGSCHFEQRVRGGEADDLAVANVDLVPGCCLTNGVEYPEERRSSIVDEIHRDLHDLGGTGRDAHGLDRWKSAIRLPHPTRDPLGDRETGRVEIDVKGDERATRPDDRGACGPVETGGTKVWSPTGLSDPLRESAQSPGSNPL